MIKDLVFSDLFVASNLKDSWYKATPDSFTAQPIESAHEHDLMRLREHLDSKIGASEFRVDWPDSVSGVRLRVKRMHVAGDQVMYVCRRFRMAPGSLSSLGMPSGVRHKLVSPDLKDGLVVFMGKAGSGKTTTATSFISERLSEFGGVCWTVENPIELRMQGKHGKGWCYQTEASSDAGIGPGVRDMLRATPNIIFIGELRDGAAVREAIAAATSGHLVVATFHAADLLSGISRLAWLANEDRASFAIADALQVAIHLSLYNLEPNKPLPGSAFCVPEAKGTGTPPRILSVEPLWFSGAGVSDGIKTMLRDGEIHKLVSEIDRQRRGFMGKLP